MLATSISVKPYTHSPFPSPRHRKASFHHRRRRRRRHGLPPSSTDPAPGLLPARRTPAKRRLPITPSCLPTHPSPTHPSPTHPSLHDLMTWASGIPCDRGLAKPLPKRISQRNGAMTLMHTGESPRNGKKKSRRASSTTCVTFVGREPSPSVQPPSGRAPPKRSATGACCCPCLRRRRPSQAWHPPACPCPRRRCLTRQRFPGHWVS